MDAVVFAILAGALFAALAIGVRFALRTGADPEVGALPVVATGALVAALASIPSLDELEWGDLWPFLIIGVFVPGASQLVFILAVRDAGPARASIVIGTAPLLSVLLALAFLDEPFRPLLLLGTALIVGGGVALAGEGRRPAAFRAMGLVLALVCAVLFAFRDNAVRLAAREVSPPPVAAAAASLVGASLVVAAYLLLFRRERLRAGLPAATRAFAPAGVGLGLAYTCLVVAFDRGRVGVVAPLNATQSLWAVVFAAVLLRSSEAIGKRTFLAGALVVAGGALIGAVR